MSLQTPVTLYGNESLPITSALPMAEPISLSLTPKYLLAAVSVITTDRGAIKAVFSSPATRE